MQQRNSVARAGAALAVVMGALLSTWSFAATDTWTIDGAHSTVGFKIRHMMVSNVTGTFGTVEGTFTADEKDVTKLTTEATIDAKSVNTNNAKRDEHLRASDFFETEKFPTITFKSTKVVKAGKAFKIVGNLTMKGVTKEVTLNVDEFTKPIVDMQKNWRRGLNATTKINRKDFNVAWNKTLDAGGVALGDEVDVNIALELTKPNTAPAAATEKKS